MAVALAAVLFVAYMPKTLVVEAPVANAPEPGDFKLALEDYWRPMAPPTARWAKKHAAAIGPAKAARSKVQGFECASRDCSTAVTLTLLTGHIGSRARDFRDMAEAEARDNVADLARYHCGSNATLDLAPRESKSGLRVFRTLCRGRNEMSDMVFWGSDWVLWKDRFLLINVLTGAPLENSVTYLLNDLTNLLAACEKPSSAAKSVVSPEGNFEIRTGLAFAGSRPGFPRTLVPIDRHLQDAALPDAGGRQRRWMDVAAADLDPVCARRQKSPAGQGSAPAAEPGVVNEDEPEGRGLHRDAVRQRQLRLDGATQAAA